MRHRILFTPAMALLTVITASCLFPERYEAEIDVRRNGDYSFKFDGVLAELTMMMAEAEGELSAQDERDAKALEGDILEDPNVKAAEYVGHGRYRVSYSMQGNLNSAVDVPVELTQILSIELLDDGIVEIRGPELGAEDIAMLKGLQLEIDGRLKVKTNGDVVSHNAMTKPRLWGLIGSYGWKIESAEDPAPHMLIRISI